LQAADNLRRFASALGAFVYRPAVGSSQSIPDRSDDFDKASTLPATDKTKAGKTTHVSMAAEII